MFPQINTLKFFPEICISCENCIKVCPHQVFSKTKNQIQLSKKERCMECGACELNCPVQAISVKSGVGCALAYIMGWLNGTEPNCDCDGC